MRQYAKYSRVLFRQYRIILVRGLRSQIFRQNVQIISVHTDVWILIFGQSDGIICKQGVRHELCGVALRGETLKKNGFLTKVLVILLPFAALVIMYFIAKLVSENITFPECGIYKILNIYCPGCGITRAAEALARGVILLSLRQNAFPVFILTVGLLFYIELLFWAFGKRVRLPVHSLKFVYIALIFWGVYVVARNLIPAVAPI